MNAHQYRVTVEHLYSPHPGEALDPPLVFETSSQDALMLLYLVNRMRERLGPDADEPLFDLPPRRRVHSTRPL